MSFRYKIGLVVLVAVLGTAALYIPSWWQKYQVDKAISELQRPYREDIYGGKTPEETFDMFLEELKNGDLAAASKFFVLKKQEEYLEKFEKMKEDGILAKKIAEWESARKEWTKVVDTYNNWKTHATVRYKYEQLKAIEIFDKLSNKKEILPAGIYTSEIIFDLNELTSVWKITLL
ncbi:hypothetical protein A3B19_03275 [Candidatus Giovannonibacteria bacterium RIFCSPLOWO2_01_FULL_46_32]|uniref:Uncharacterized protein n=1 Tax=Candidatus Giovannonibacteria bacterium RIFCSPLOWO2_01_FULL_46_32 TaxID=1798353 RepID=A0A1F5XH95_9BACT|nr:MAG: hypothetical protein A3B19_03275 [Candidatus Giovannonibacteria bacterium RIFCSPLOWO2_01_FULL_46_32]